MYNGIINVYKEAGFTSFDVVAKLRGITRIRKIGHTGTLDPDATGVLPVCIGSATKLCDMLTDKTKEYEATFRLGMTTDTQDISGNVEQECEVDMVDITTDKIKNVVASFTGKQQQIPPMYSAIKINGQKLYDLARAGKVVEREPRDIEIHYIDIEKIEVVPRAFSLPENVNKSDLNTYEIVMRVGCSKGTYIRTLCYDIGQKLGCGATMTKLVRTRSGQFELENALTLTQIEKIFHSDNASELIADVVIPVDKVFEENPLVTVTGDQEKRVLNGNFIKNEYIGDRIRVYLSDGTFAAVYDFSKENGCYKPYKMFLS